MRKDVKRQYGSAGADGILAGAPPTLCDALDAYRGAIQDGGEQSGNFLSEIADSVLAHMTKNMGLKYTARQLMDAIDTCHPQTKADEYELDVFRDAADKHVSIEGEVWNDDPKFRASL